DNKLSVSANGTVYFKVTDVAGNVTTESVVVDKIDTVAPTLAISGNAAEWVKSVTLKAAASDSASDIAKVEYSLDGKSWTSGSSVDVTANGTVYFKATDKVGNVTTDSVVVDKIDNAAPTVSTSVNTTAAKVSSVLVSATAADAASGVAAIKYSLNGTDWMDYTESVRMVDNGNIYFQSIDALGNKSEVAIVTVDNIGDLNSDILHNGFSQIVGYDANRGAVGYIAYEGAAGAQWQGVWEWSGDEIAKWNVVAVGRFGSGSVDNDGLLLYNTTNNTFAAWTDLGKGDYGYESLCWVESNFSTKCIANLDGDGIDDVLIVNGEGNFGAVLNAKEYKDIWHEEGKSGIELVGAGYFGKADGNDSLLVKNTAANTYELWHNDGDIATTWAWSGEKIADLDSDWEIAAIGDFKADGIDDIVVWQKSTGYMYAWEDGKAESKRWVGALEHGDWEVAAVGDYNSDGKEDLLLRELVSGWGGLGYWGGANADNWNDLNARIESDNNGSKFGVIA
ncbi:MAG: VCBS repeat-containing protein, partial [Lentisphaeria bacterium]|nr:VCBS repeat-containing protein [Lentisphaeria bacterium]